MANTMDIKVPDIGDVEQVEVIEVLVSVGDSVAIDDSLITVESDKASMEIPAMVAGIIRSLDIKVGANVSAGDTIGSIEAVAESATVADDATNAEAAASTPPVVEDLPSAPEVSDTPKAPPPPPAAQKPTSPTAHLDNESHRKAHASPGVRRYAREHGVALGLVAGTGPKKRIVKSDVTAFIKQSLEGAGSNYGGVAGASGGSGIPPIPAVDFSKFGDIERVELSRINKLSATNLHRAWLNIPLVTHHDEADITDMEEFRKQTKAQAREGDPKVTGLAFHMKALVQTLKAFPKVNSSLSPDGQALFIKHYYHIGIAVDTPNGLVVPVIRDVDKKSISDLAVDMADLSTRARGKKLKPDEMQGASMTISSLGGIGGSAFTPIVNPPEVAILGITRAKMQPVWDGNEFIPRLICPLDLSYDHRVVDGADAARFMAYYCNCISDIRRLLL